VRISRISYRDSLYIGLLQILALFPGISRAGITMSGAGQVLVGSLICGIAAYFTVRFLVRYFETRTLTPFAVYCLVAGGASLVCFTAF
jgi:undecaprenyl-diphosphatase